MPRLVTWRAPSTPFRAQHVPVGREFLRQAESRGELMRLACGVYIATAASSQDARMQHLLQALALQVRFDNPIVCSHETAAALHGIPLLHSSDLPATPRFILDPDQGRNRPGTPRIQVTPLPAGHICTVTDGPLAGLVATTPARTALDLTSEGDLVRGLMALDHVARTRALRWCRPGDLRGPNVRPERLRAAVSELDDVHATLTRRGRRRRREALTLVDPRHESPGESASIARIHQAGLPAPLVQARIQTDDGTFFSDFYWPDFGVVGECDGAVKYLGGMTSEGQAAADQRRIQEKSREIAIVRRGLTFVRWMASEPMYSPWRWLDHLTHALRAGGADV